MELKLLTKGRIFSIYAVVLENGTCPAQDFMQRLRRENLASHKSLMNIIQRHADSGPIRNMRKSRDIEGKQGLFEFKTFQGDRLLYCYLPDNRTALMNGFHKGASASREYNKAEAIMRAWRKEGTDG